MHRFFAMDMRPSTAEDLYIFSSSPRSLHIALMSDLLSAVSYMVNAEVYPSLSAYGLMRCTQTLWKVPIDRYLASCAGTSLRMRSFISRAALLVNVSAIICPAGIPCCSIYAMR